MLWFPVHRIYILIPTEMGLMCHPVNKQINNKYKNIRINKLTLALLQRRD